MQKKIERFLVSIVIGFLMARNWYLGGNNIAESSVIFSLFFLLYFFLTTINSKCSYFHFGNTLNKPL